MAGQKKGPSYAKKDAKLRTKRGRTKKGPDEKGAGQVGQKRGRLRPSLREKVRHLSPLWLRKSQEDISAGTHEAFHSAEIRSIM